MIESNILTLLTIISLVLLLFMGIYILKIKNKKQIHFAFLVLIVLLFIWTLSVILEETAYIYFNYSGDLFMYIGYTPVFLSPITLLLTSLIFANTRINFNLKTNILFLPALVSLVILFTNRYHKLFIVKYSIFQDQIVYGKYEMVSTFFACLYTMIALFFLIRYSIKNSGFFSRQAILIIAGTILPVTINILELDESIRLPACSTPIAFSFAVICWILAIFKFDFLNITPIALQKVVDHISDSFIVINENLEVIDFNKTLTDTFDGILNIKRKDNLIELIKSNEVLGEHASMLKKGIHEAITRNKSIGSEIHITSGFFNMFFKIEITPITTSKIHIGTIILLRDITEQKRNIEKIRNTQKQLVERERLASLGEMIGGVAHDINSPLSSLQNFAKESINLIQEYEDSVEDPEVTVEDHKEIAGEMRENINRILSVSNRIAGIVNSVRNHTRNLSGGNSAMVDLKTIIEDMKVLLGHELRRSNCELIYKEDKRTTLSIDQGKLGQVMTNLINNAIQAYEGAPGVVEVNASNTNNEILISVKDYGKGIDPSIKNGIFKEILSTKGTKGTGMGLYISYMIITGHFGGKMWFESEVGKGSTIFFAIPKYISNEKTEEKAIN